MISWNWEFDGIEEILAGLDRRFARVEERKAALMDQYGIWLMELAAQLSPFDTGFMASHVIYTPLSKGWHDFEVGWYRKDFDLAGHPPYYFWQEFGTEMMAAAPSLEPAWRELSPWLEKDAAAMLLQAMTDPL